MALVDTSVGLHLDRARAAMRIAAMTVRRRACGAARIAIREAHTALARAALATARARFLTPPPGILLRAKKRLTLIERHFVVRCTRTLRGGRR